GTRRAGTSGQPRGPKRMHLEARPRSDTMGGSSRLGREALVVGGGIGGLAAACALSNHFERVTILERDEAPDSPAVPRPGVPQGKQLHALLAGGHRALDELFPGVVDDLDEAGAPRLTQGLDLRIERPGFDPFVQRDLGFYSYGVTRPHLEFCVRRRVEAPPSVRFGGRPGAGPSAKARSEAAAASPGPLTTTDERAIGGVRCQRAGRS